LTVRRPCPIVAELEALERTLARPVPGALLIELFLARRRGDERLA